MDEEEEKSLLHFICDCSGRFRDLECLEDLPLINFLRFVTKNEILILNLMYGREEEKFLLHLTYDFLRFLCMDHFRGLDCLKSVPLIHLLRFVKGMGGFHQERNFNTSQYDELFLSFICGREEDESVLNLQFERPGLQFLVMHRFRDLQCLQDVSLINLPRFVKTSGTEFKLFSLN